ALPPAAAPRAVPRPPREGRTARRPSPRRSGRRGSRRAPRASAARPTRRATAACATRARAAPAPPRPSGEGTAARSASARRRRPGARRACVLPRRRVGLEAASDHRTRETEAVEIGGVVARDARRQHLSLPGARRQLEPLQLADDLEEPVAAVELRPRLHVLPAEEEAHQVGGGDGLDLPAQAAEGQAVDARQEAALA